MTNKMRSLEDREQLVAEAQSREREGLLELFRRKSYDFVKKVNCAYEYAQVTEDWKFAFEQVRNEGDDNHLYRNRDGMTLNLARLAEKAGQPDYLYGIVERLCKEIREAEDKHKLKSEWYEQHIRNANSRSDNDEQHIHELKQELLGPGRESDFVV